MQVEAGLPSVLRFIAGCIPLYAAYTALGTIMFGRYCGKFATLGRESGPAALHLVVRTSHRMLCKTG